MSTDVHDQLDRLAQRAPSSSPPPDLWQRGVRLRRRRVATGLGAALTVAVVVAVGAGTAGVAWNRLGSMQATASTPRPAIPTRLEPPGPWTPGTDRAGAPGRLAVVAGAARRTGVLGTERDGLVGISAETGRYVFLDLPGQLPDSSGMISDDTPVSLSPTGRYVAYWLGGRPAVGARYGETAVGAAVYDTVTGQVRRLRIPSARGLSPERLAWVDDATVATGYSRITARDAASMSAVEAAVRLWSPSTGAVAGVPGARAPSPSDDLAATVTGFSAWDGLRLSLWSARGATYRQRVLRVQGLNGSAGLGNHLVAPDGRRVAVVSTDGGTSGGRLYVGRVPGSGGSVEVRGVDVGGRRSLSVQSVVGWRDRTHVVVEVATGGRAEVRTVEVGTGASTSSVAVRGQSYTPGRVYASALWRTAPVVRPGPVRTYDPRALAAGTGLIGLVLLGGILAVRRRRALL